MKLNVEKYPEELGEKVSNGRVEGTKTVLGLDLGTNCGYSYCFIHNKLGDKPRIYAGQLDLSAGPYDSGAIRFLRLRHFLSAIKPDLIAYEDVRYTPSVKGFMSAGALLARAAPACEWFGALKATVSTWAEENGVPCTGIPIGSIKKRATGKGNANKVDIIKACNNEFGFDFDHEGYESSGADNVADSVYVCTLAVESYGLGFNPERENEDARQ
jgi:hypothetical protein